MTTPHTATSDVLPTYRDGRIYHPNFPGGSIPSRVQPELIGENNNSDFEVLTEITNQLIGEISAAEAREESKDNPDQGLLQQCDQETRRVIQRNRQLDLRDTRAIKQAIQADVQAVEYWKNR